LRGGEDERRGRGSEVSLREEVEDRGGGGGDGSLRGEREGRARGSEEERGR
jgi:hypothetical protein